MAEVFSVNVATKPEALDIQARFTVDMEGPMRTERAQFVADAIADIVVLDADTAIGYREPIVPIDPTSYRPNYDLAEPTPVTITTEVPKQRVFDIFIASERAVAEAAGRDY